MSTKSTLPSPASKPPVNAVPDGMHTVTPHLVCAGAADAIQFYSAAFNATEICRLPGPDGKLMHAAVQLGDSVVFLADELPQCGSLSPKSLGGSPVTLHLYVADVDAFVDGAVRAGAKIVLPVQDMFWGDRYGVLQDPFGHRWSVATHVRDLSPAEMQQAAQAACVCS